MHHRMIYRNRRLKEFINMMINIIISVASFIRLWRTLWLICLQNAAKLDMLRKGLKKCFRKNMVSWNEIYIYIYMYAQLGEDQKALSLFKQALFENLDDNISHFQCEPNSGKYFQGNSQKISCFFFFFGKSFTSKPTNFGYNYKKMQGHSSP